MSGRLVDFVVTADTPNSERVKNRLNYRTIIQTGRRKLAKVAYWLASRLVDLNQRRAARVTLSWATKYRQPDKSQLSLISRAWLGQRGPKRISVLQVEHLKSLAERPLEEKNYARLLYLLARYEILQINAPVVVGDAIARQLVSDAGQTRIKQAAEKALEQLPNSPFLMYLYSVTLAKSGDYERASQLLSTRIQEVSSQVAKTDYDKKLAKKKFEILRNAWRVVDLIARENMGWLDGERGGSYEQLVSQDNQSRSGATTQSWLLNFKEPLLQTRNEKAYLDMCLVEFNETGFLMIKLKSIKEMLRQGARRQLDYHRAYKLANECFDEVNDGLDEIISSSTSSRKNTRQALLAVQIIALAMDVCRSLKRTEELDALKNVIFKFSVLKDFREARWVMLPTLVLEDIEIWGPVSREIRNALINPPANELQLKSYLLWAMHMRDFDAAERIFVKLPAALQGSLAALFFVNILQRQSRFTDALNRIKRIHAYMLAKPAQLNPYQHWNLIRRYGELNFLRITSNTYLSERQPTNPKGVILLGARNIDQLRKYPILVLVELKRRGWAVVPLVEGYLPRELTGNPEIDVLNGCLTIEIQMTPEAKHVFDPIENFNVDLDKGILNWGKMDFSHSLLEDVRINRRAFDIDFTCPALQTYLQKLVDWTELYGRACNYALEHFSDSGIRTGLMSLYNSRMPDALFRHYCDEFGDANSFFCLQTANGYENYFTNFKTSISTRCVIRNMTEYSETRSSSLPVPDLFNEYYEHNKHLVEDAFTRIQHVADMRRTTSGDQTVVPAAVACEERIHQWRDKGGKVACLFGRVVCDSAVPYDGGPAHRDLKDWLNHSIDAVRGTNTMLLIKPHPHELNEQIATYLNEYFADLIEGDIPENVVILGHRWFDIQALERFIDLGVIYNSTTAIEMALMEIPCVLCGYFGPIDYPVGHIVPKNKRHYENLLQFKSRSKAAPDMRARAALWLDYMSNSKFTIDYRYHSRPITNKVVYPPYWIEGDLDTYKANGDRHVELLASRVIGTLSEPSR